MEWEIGVQALGRSHHGYQRLAEVPMTVQDKGTEEEKEKKEKQEWLHNLKPFFPAAAYNARRTAKKKSPTLGIAKEGPRSISRYAALWWQV